MHKKINSRNPEINVWLFNQNANSPDLPGGTRHFDFAKELKKKNINLIIFTSNFHSFERKKVRELQKRYRMETIHSIQFVWIQSSRYRTNGIRRVINMFVYAWTNYLVASHIRLEKPDLVIGSSPHLLTALSAYLVSRAYKVKYILEVRDIWPQTLIDLGHNKFHPFIVFLKIIEIFLYKKATKIIMLMPRGIKYLKEEGIDTRKFTWISNGVDFYWLKNRKNPIYSLNRDFFNITYAGTLGEANDIETIVEAAKLVGDRFPKIRINLVGNGVKRKWAEQQIKFNKIKNLIISDPVAKNQIFSILSSSDTLLFTLKEAKVFKYGNPPNKIFDYLACKKPIIFSSNASNNLVKESGSGIFIKPSNPKKLAEAMVRAFKLSKKKQLALGKNGYFFVKKNYQIHQLAKKMHSAIISSV